MPPFLAGQVWTYPTRPGEEASRIIICRVETRPHLGQVVHLHVAGIRVRNDRAPGGFTDQISHMPYRGDALRALVNQLESTTPHAPAYLEGYNLWREAFDRGEAGVWTIAIAEAITLMEQAINRPSA